MQVPAHTTTGSVIAMTSQAVARGAGAKRRMLTVGAALLQVGSLVAAPQASAADEPTAGSGPAIHGHSLRAIRAALVSPPDAEMARAASDFDQRLLRTGKLGAMEVRPVAGAPLQRAQAIVARLAAAAPRRHRSEWTVRVLDSATPQDTAFVAGGSVIYVYTGLLARAESDDELAFVLAHEMAHTTLKHDRRQDADLRNRKVDALQASAERKGAEARPGLRQVRDAILAAYSRADEQEADALGACIAHRAGYDPARAVSYFERQMAADPAGPRSTAQTPAVTVPQRWAALAAKASQTHPADQERLAALVAVDDHLDGRRSLDSLSQIGQGYRVLRALEELLKR